MYGWSCLIAGGKGRVGMGVVESLLREQVVGPRPTAACRVCGKNISSTKFYRKKKCNVMILFLSAATSISAPENPLLPVFRVDIAYGLTVE